MKSRMLALVAVLTATAGAASAADPPQPYVKATGTVVSNVTPDQLVWQLTVRHAGPALGPLAEQHSVAVANVLKFIRTTGVKDEHLQTSDMAFGENWEYSGTTRVRNGYFASTSITFTSTDLMKYKETYIGLAQLGGVSIDGVNYSYSKRPQVQADTRLSALEAARTKAQAMAMALGCTLGAPIAIEEVPLVGGGYQVAYNENRQSNIAGSGGDGDNEVSIAPGKVAVTIRVEVTFKLISH